MSFFSELKRRNVFRVALLYIVATWLIIQVADVGISILGLPVWTGRLVFLLLFIGFPLVMVFSWAYEITPEGVKREKDVLRDQSITDKTARKLNTAVIVLLVLALGGMIVDRLIPESSAPLDTKTSASDEAKGPPEQSIAVLPFVNMSADQQNEYFSDGLSEELLNLLARIPELQVAARTSAFSFKDSNADIVEIANRLNVAHILEGSVRKSGDEIRVTAQLIKAADGYHLWSDTWDRTLDDVFAIQDEIAGSVVDALKVTLLGEVPRARITNAQAYELYLKSKPASDLSTEESMDEAVRLLMQALAIDPEYAEGWVELGTVQTNQVGQGFRPAAEGFAQARASAERALKIDPDMARAMSNLGWIAMYWDHDFVEASRLYNEARRREPGNASVLNSYAVLNGTFGRYDSMISLYEEALVRDPVAMSVLSNLTGAYLRSNLERSAELLDRMREVSPESSYVPIFSGWIQQFHGNSEAALEIFSGIEGDSGAWGRAIALYDLGRDTESDRALEELKEFDATSVQIAVVYAYRDQKEQAFEWLDRAYEERDDWLIEIRMFDGFKSLHSDPRWDELLQRIGISDADAERIDL